MSQESDPPPTTTAASDTKRALARCLFISRILLYTTYALGFALAIWILYALIHDGSEGEYYAFAIAGVFVGLSVPLTLHDINLHLLHYVDPLQAQVMRILWMVPVYSIESWLALVYRDKAVYLKAMVACYESYVLYSFFQLMLGSTGGKLRLSVRLLETGKDRAPCVIPCCCLRGWKMGSRFVHRCTVGVYQYVFINTIVAFLQIITESNHRYKDGVWDFRNFYPWASLAINCSQMTALFVLAYFYIHTHDWLYPIQPLFKLLSVANIYRSFFRPHTISSPLHTHHTHTLQLFLYHLIF
jgi:hypothetical protein